MRKSSSQRLYRGAAALILASVFNHFADRILGIKIEAFPGNVLEYFSPLWVLDLFLVPFLAGVLVSAIYGFGGKWCVLLPAADRAGGQLHRNCPYHRRAAGSTH